jgi:DNA-binding NtrC family response regulator
MSTGQTPNRPLSQPGVSARPSSEPQLNAWIAALGRMSAAHPDMARILRIVERLQDRPYRAHVIVYGEPGTGKEGLARLLHRLMHPDGAELVRAQLLGRDLGEQRELLLGPGFGREIDVPGGLLASARGGSLLIDELLALPAAMQRQILDQLQERRGEPDPVIIGLSDGDLVAAVEAGHFRHDLFYKLSRIVLRVPPLRERPEDMAHATLWIANRVLRARGVHRPAELEAAGEQAVPLSPDAYRVQEGAVLALRRHAWPGNFREMEGVLERAILLYSDGERLTAADVEQGLDDCVQPAAATAPGTWARP